MTVPLEIFQLSAVEGLTFLEHLAHHLTIGIRSAADARQPQGSLTDEQSRKAIYWINEALHNVVQLTRDIRMGRTMWESERMAGWVDLWLKYSHSEKYNREAVERAMLETLHPYQPCGSRFTAVKQMFGDPGRFAIEAMSEPDLQAPSAVWGRMCLHVGPVVLGDITNEHCGLYGAYSGLAELINNTTRLWDDSFAGLTHERIHDLVHAAIYKDDERSLDAIQADAGRYGRFDFLTNWGEQFDGFSSVIVQCEDTTTTILHRPYLAQEPQRRSGAFISATCSSADFRKACVAFINWFDSETARLTPQ